MNKKREACVCPGKRERKFGGNPLSGRADVTAFLRDMQIKVSPIGENVLKNIFYLHMSKKCCIFATNFGIELKKHET